MWEASAELDALHIVRDLAAGMNDPRGTPAQDWAEKAPPEGNGITFTEMSEAFRGMRDDAMEKAVATYTAHDNLAAKLCEGLKDLDNEDRAKPGSIFDEINEKLRRDFYVDEPMAEQEDPAITQWKQMAAEEIEIAVREVMTGEVSEISLSLPSPNADLSDTKAMELARWVQQRVTMEIALWH
jgi:vacuolar-type H+-ATPase subunit F/Vma7